MAITIPDVDALPDAPTKSDPNNFAARADTFLSALEVFSTQLGATITELNKLTHGIDNIEPAPEYSAVTTYNFPEIVACTDGFTYRCVGSSVVGQDPITDDGTYWVKQVTPSILEVVDEVDLTGVGAATLDGINYDVFYVSNFNQSTTLTINIAVGRTLTVAMLSPGANSVDFAISGVTIYWEAGTVVEPEAVGITLVTVTRLTSTVAVASYSTGHVAVA